MAQTQGMSPADKEMATIRARFGRRLHCRKCCRREWHSLIHPRLLVYATLGLILLVGPYRCVCCGQLRLFTVHLALRQKLAALISLPRRIGRRLRSRRSSRGRFRRGRYRF
jgi:hypothetical protein